MNLTPSQKERIKQALVAMAMDWNYSSKGVEHTYQVIVQIVEEEPTSEESSQVRAKNAQGEKPRRIEPLKITLSYSNNQIIRAINAIIHDRNERLGV